MEILSPAGSPEALRAAVCAGANAVYLGFGQFNARRGARNFSRDEFASAVSYCHLRGVKVYLTLNTLCSDREMGDAVDCAVQASKLGVDAALVQDLGLVRALRQAAPTQATKMERWSPDTTVRCRTPARFSTSSTGWGRRSRREKSIEATRAEASPGACR